MGPPGPLIPHRESGAQSYAALKTQLQRHERGCRLRMNKPPHVAMVLDTFTADVTKKVFVHVGSRNGDLATAALRSFRY